MGSSSILKKVSEVRSYMPLNLLLFDKSLASEIFELFFIIILRFFEQTSLLPVAKIVPVQMTALLLAIVVRILYLLMMTVCCEKVNVRVSTEL